MGTELAGPGDPGEGFGQEGSDIAPKSLDGAEIGGKAMGNDPGGKNRWCVNLQGERYRLRERMLEQRGGALDIRYWRRGLDERGRSRTS